MFHADIKVKICENEQIFGPGIVTLLENVGKTGSVKKACAGMGMSYSKGWKIINRAEDALGYKLIERRHGGKSGGSCQVTEQGEKMLFRFREMEKEIRKYVELSFAKHFPEL